MFLKEIFCDNCCCFKESVNVSWPWCCRGGVVKWTGLFVDIPQLEAGRSCILVVLVVVIDDFEVEDGVRI